jgi:hypothetical protein
VPNPSGDDTHKLIRALGRAGFKMAQIFIAMARVVDRSIWHLYRCIQAAFCGVLPAMSLSKTPPLERPWHTTSLVHISRWRLDCPSSQVWDLLSCPENWPQWWQQLSRVEILKPSGASDCTTHALLHWRSQMGLSCRVHCQTTRCEQDAHGRGEIESHAQGCFQGMGLWVIEPYSIRGVDITYRWEVRLHKPWMRLFAPALRGLLSWNHFNVMQAGAQGMARQLGCHSPLVSNWSGGVR